MVILNPKSRCNKKTMSAGATPEFQQLELDLFPKITEKETTYSGSEIADISGLKYVPIS